MACNVNDFVLPKLSLHMKHIKIGLFGFPDATDGDSCCPLLLLLMIEFVLLVVLPEGDNPDVLFGPLLLMTVTLFDVVVVSVVFDVDEIRSLSDASRADTTRNE